MKSTCHISYLLRILPALRPERSLESKVFYMSCDNQQVNSLSNASFDLIMPQKHHGSLLDAFVVVFVATRLRALSRRAPTEALYVHLVVYGSAI